MQPWVVSLLKAGPDKLAGRSREPRFCHPIARRPLLLRAGRRRAAVDVGRGPTGWDRRSGANCNRRCNQKRGWASPILVEAQLLVEPPRIRTVDLRITSPKRPLVGVVLVLVELPWTSVGVRHRPPAWLLCWLLACDLQYPSCLVYLAYCDLKWRVPLITEVRDWTTSRHLRLMTQYRDGQPCQPRTSKYGVYGNRWQFADQTRT
jgi:hypothetical protein